MSDISYYIRFNEQGKQTSMVASETNPSTEDSLWQKLPDDLIRANGQPISSYFILVDGKITKAIFDPSKDEVMLGMLRDQKKSELKNYANDYKDAYVLSFKDHEYDGLERIKSFITEQLMLAFRPDITLFDRRKKENGSHEHTISASDAKQLMGLILQKSRDFKRAYDGKDLALKALETIAEIENFDVKFVV